MDNKPFPFKKIFWAIVFLFTPVTILSSLLAFFDIVPVDFNSTPRNGFEGFIIPILYLPFAVLMMSGLFWVTLNLGNWMHVKFLNLNKKENN
ncbi:MAG: hypothetical protein EOP47_00040 [Sphingobacteriaceae bacterium]|nr:MAG: hypothetical protein EOP47_00040 [Sphingobacteriaceae bacterium]